MKLHIITFIELLTLKNYVVCSIFLQYKQKAFWLLNILILACAQSIMLLIQNTPGLIANCKMNIINIKNTGCLYEIYYCCIHNNSLHYTYLYTCVFQRYNSLRISIFYVNEYIKTLFLLEFNLKWIWLCVLFYKPRE